MDSEINRVARVENAHFCSFRRGLSFVRFLLVEVSDRLRRLPQWIVECSIQLRSAIGANRFGGLCSSHFYLTCRRRVSLRKLKSMGIAACSQSEQRSEDVVQLVDSADQVSLARTV